ncbi:hypothetical protein OB2597_05110 [Pseudooceanicola batsensis HTCC2597]|uniref:Uncharacterized protein n=1 Tax=Pseudooceanicola batsensis (strain ATCC BAA-863 / DSM 15984 / KCTC 12145 / HTCC2597) TaxID=252305 RepID=A3TSK7_PSEBH|nr:hypothetical protein [Pseudooceanicola batsensis]EAQ04634.1 hypothetical protein OB2597_05110 [Pseudooceanicola batsensis HTCC2597]
MSVREIAEKLGPVHEVKRHTSGSQEVVVLRPSRAGEPIKAIVAALALARCGTSLPAAKRAIERVVDAGDATVILPTVFARHDLARALASTGIDVAFSSEVGSCQL